MWMINNAVIMEILSELMNHVENLKHTDLSGFPPEISGYLTWPSFYDLNMKCDVCIFIFLLSINLRKKNNKRI